MPWKNGGGETLEVAVSPPGAGLADFDWRVSMARVEIDGPFSVFPGVDRSLSLLEGEGMVVVVDGLPPIEFARRFEPVAFPADLPTSARLMDGPILDLNVMTRRGVFAHAVQASPVEGVLRVTTGDGPALLMCATGTVDAACSGLTETLRYQDCLMLDAGPCDITLSSRDGAIVMVIEFRHIWSP